MFRKISTLAIIISLAVSSCSLFNSLTSNTTITPQNSFVLGDNQHGKFSAKITNVSKQLLQILLKPVGGETTLLKTLQPNETTSAKVPANTAVIIQNSSNDTVSVDLKITGDTGLSMTYKK